MAILAKTSQGHHDLHPIPHSKPPTEVVKKPPHEAANELAPESWTGLILGG